jgi:methyl-accepting chemotaxis protein
MTIGKRIGAGFALALGVLVVIGGLSYSSTNRLLYNNAWVEHTHDVLTALTMLVTRLTEAEAGERGFLLTGQDAYLEPYNYALERIKVRMEELRTMTADNPVQQKSLKELDPLIAKRLAQLAKAIALRTPDGEGKYGEGFKAALKIVEGDGKETMEAVKKVVARIEDEERNLLRQRSDAAEASAQVTLYTILLGTPLAVLLVSAGGFFITRSIAKSFTDAVGRLTSTSAEILASTTQQATGAQEQAATVAQTVTTLEEITQTAEQASQKAKGVGEAVERTRQVGEAGRKTVEESITALGTVQEQVETTAENILALAEQAQAIGEITATVNDLAERTNLLALNAAIEASRAGEHGKGFAVVAGEVKALADQSKKATAQVRQILGEIQKATNTAVLSTEEVTKGVANAAKVAGQAGDAIKTLADALSEAARAAAQIVASAGQQATGMAQIHQATRNIDQVAKQNLSAMRQAEQAAQNLNDLAGRLAALVGK